MSGDKNDPQVSARFQARTKRIEAEQGKDPASQSVARRLTTAELNRRVKVPVRFDEGETILIEFYVPTGSEFDEMNRLLRGMASGEDGADIALCTMIGNLSVDPELGPDYWSRLESTTVIGLGQIIDGLTANLSELLKDAKWFRDYTAGRLVHPTLLPPRDNPEQAR
jgi:hypothetical protein